MSTETKFTPGPWRWELNLKMKQIKLCGGVPRYDLTVMDFVRWGMGGCQPRFLRIAQPDHMLLEKSESFSEPVKGREHHENWFRAINHPDAKLMAASPEMYAILDEILMSDGLMPDTLGKINQLFNKINQ